MDKEKRSYSPIKFTVAEIFFGPLKKESVKTSNYKTALEAKSDSVDYIEMFYNNSCRHSHLGDLVPRKVLSN